MCVRLLVNPSTQHLLIRASGVHPPVKETRKTIKEPKSQRGYNIPSLAADRPPGVSLTKDSLGRSMGGLGWIGWLGWIGRLGWMG